MSAEVFISYAAKDRERVLGLVKRLRDAGVTAWIDQAGIDVSTMWSQEIVAAIRNCKVLILAISKKSGNSENVVKELALASEGRKRILPVYLEHAEIPESMAYQLAGIQRVEFFKGNEEAGHQSVIRALAKLGITVNDEASIALAGGPKRTSHGISHSTTGQAATSKRSASMKIAVAVGGVVALATSLFFLTGSGSETNEQEQTKPLAKVVTLDANRVVVLPFKTIGTSGETADLGYGLVSTLTSKLQPLQNLTVIANESAWKYEGSKLSPHDTGKALQVGTIVTGEIQTSGSKIQVNIRVIDANTEALEWGNTFTKNKEEFLDLQNEIATQLASALKGGLNTTEEQQLAQKATESAEAQAEYQTGRREWNKRSKEGFENAIKHFEKAIKLDSDYANPYAGLADTYGLFPIYDIGLSGDAMPKAKNYAEKAIELNPNFAEPYASLAWVQNNFEFDWLAAESNFEKAIKINPNYATAYQWYGLQLLGHGKTKEAIDRLNTAFKLDPTSLIIPTNLAQSYQMDGQNKVALEILEKPLSVNPNFIPSLQTFSRVEPDKDIVIERLKKAIEAYPMMPMPRRNLIERYIKRGETELAKDQLIILLDRFHDGFDNMGYVEIYAQLGDYETALKWMEKAVNEKAITNRFSL